MMNSRVPLLITLFSFNIYFTPSTSEKEKSSTAKTCPKHFAVFACIDYAEKQRLIILKKKNERNCWSVTFLYILSTQVSQEKNTLISLFLSHSLYIFFVLFILYAPPHTSLSLSFHGFVKLRKKYLLFQRRYISYISPLCTSSINHLN